MRGPSFSNQGRTSDTRGEFNSLSAGQPPANSFQTKDPPYEEMLALKRELYETKTQSLETNYEHTKQLYDLNNENLKQSYQILAL
jgi:hypothetical protein